MSFAPLHHQPARLVRIAHVRALLLLVALVTLLPRQSVFGAGTRPGRSNLSLLSGDIRGSVTDSVSGRPIASADISVVQSGRVVVNTITDDFGRYTAHNLTPGTYTVSVHFIGFRPAS